jgi:hypothetical protein
VRRPVRETGGLVREIADWGSGAGVAAGSGFIG